MKDTGYKYISYRADRNRYQVAFPVTVPDAKAKRGVRRQRIIKQAATLEEALEERDRLLKLYNMDASLLVKIEKHVTSVPIEEREFARLFCEWYNTIKSAELSVSTRAKYRRQVELLSVMLEKKKIGDLSKELIDAIIRSEETRSYSRANTTRSVLNSFFRDVGKTELCSNIVIQSKKHRQMIREALTVSEVHKVLAYLSKRRSSYAFLYAMFFITGCRRSELLGLTWEYVDFRHDCIYIERVLLRDENNHNILVNRTKTKASRRTVCLPPQAMKRLKFWYIIRKSQGHAGKNDLVFVNKYGEPVNPSKISTYFHQAVKACGIQKHVTLHSARHTFATILANAGVPLFVIQKAGGWSDLKTLEGHYLHEDTSRIKSYIDMSGLWDGIL